MWSKIPGKKKTHLLDYRMTTPSVIVERPVCCKVGAQDLITNYLGRSLQLLATSCKSLECTECHRTWLLLLGFPPLLELPLEFTAVLSECPALGALCVRFCYYANHLGIQNLEKPESVFSGYGHSNGVPGQTVIMYLRYIK